MKKSHRGSPICIKVFLVLILAAFFPSALLAEEVFPAAGAEYVGFFRVCRDLAASERLARRHHNARTDTKSPALNDISREELDIPGCWQGVMAVRPYREIETLEDLRDWNLRADLAGQLDCSAYLTAGPRLCTAVLQPAKYYQGSAYRHGHWRSAVIQAFATNLCETGICDMTLE